MFITTTEQPVDNRLDHPTFSPVTKAMTSTWTTPRILAIDPGTSLMGVAVLESHDLVYYAVKELRWHRPASRLMSATRNLVNDLIDRYRPTVLAYEQSVYVQQMSSRLLRAEEQEIRRTAKVAGLQVIAYTPTHVRQSLCGDPWSTKHMVAARLVERFPELARYRTSQSLRSERYWLNMFDALAVAVVAVSELDGGAGRNYGPSGARAA